MTSSLMVSVFIMVDASSPESRGKITVIDDTNPQKVPKYFLFDAKMRTAGQ